MNEELVRWVELKRLVELMRDCVGQWDMTQSGGRSRKRKVVEGEKE